MLVGTVARKSDSVLNLRKCMSHLHSFGCKGEPFFVGVFASLVSC